MAYVVCPAASGLVNTSVYGAFALAEVDATKVVGATLVVVDSTANEELVGSAEVSKLIVYDGEAVEIIGAAVDTGATLVVVAA